jgi:hypothetical protein
MIQVKRSVLYFFSGLLILGVNLFVLCPWITERFGSLAGNGTYIGVRLATLLGFSAIAYQIGISRRPAIIRAAIFLLFLEQVAFKSVYMSADFRAHPQGWEGVDHRAALFSLVMSFVVSVPFLILIAFVGTEIKEFIFRFRKQNSLRVS